MARTPRLGAVVATLALPIGAALSACGSSASPDAIRSTLATLPAEETPTSSTVLSASSALTTGAPRLTAPEPASTVPFVGDPTTTPTAPAPSTTGAAPTTGATTTAPGSRIRYVAEPATGALQLGHHGERVRSLQGQLLALGFVVSVDSYFGRGTEQAVLAFQRQQGLPADGIAGQPTLDRLAQLAVVP